MSIYIKGLQMPQKGEYCMTLCVFSDGSAYFDIESFQIDADRFDAIPVPPHGRLIDADALIYNIRCEILEHQMNGMLNGTPCYLDDLRTMWQTLEDEDVAPTVIPAEEEGEE